MSIPKASDVKSIALLGFGTMGHTWATALLLGDLDVHVWEADRKMADTNTGRVRGYLDSMQKKGKFSGDIDKTMARLHHLKSEAELSTCGAPILLEVIFEDMKLKLDVFTRLGKAMPKETIFWTNTSCLDIEKMAVASGRPDKFIGTHGMNPVHLMRGMEVVRHPALDSAVLELTLGMMKRIDKDAFLTDNVPGFIVNNGLIPWLIHFVNMLQRRQATVEDIDIAISSCLGHPQGVFKLTDFIGINTTILVAEELHKATLDPRYIVPPLLYDMRKAGWDGFKTGRGFWDWSDKKNPKPVAYDKLCERKA
ncbi:MAG: 3-hydroxyacyl-CoA dehydrogenase family protein [Deltaproteobacteria bacterium]|nr:3-hydroxyacyl-CoA dehydrogenase family protein [Deltaproteobacteria bacterium]